MWICWECSSVSWSWKSVSMQCDCLSPLLFFVLHYFTSFFFNLCVTSSVFFGRYYKERSQHKNICSMARMRRLPLSIDIPAMWVSFLFVTLPFRCTFKGICLVKTIILVKTWELFRFEYQINMKHSFQKNWDNIWTIASPLKISNLNSKFWYAPWGIFSFLFLLTRFEFKLRNLKGDAILHRLSPQLY